MVTLNGKADGYRGIWYMNQPTGDEYVFKYSGGLGTYCAKHSPLAVYCPAVEKTFFCYGGTTAASHLGYTAADLREGRQLERPRPGFLLHMVSYFDHRHGLVPRPTILLDKGTADAHDNPVLAVDGEGYLWIFSTSHGRSRPSFIHRSLRPYDIDAFRPVAARWQNPGGKSTPVDNFSYLQMATVPGGGFVGCFTRYRDPLHVAQPGWHCLGHPSQPLQSHLRPPPPPGPRRLLRPVGRRPRTSTFSLPPLLLRPGWTGVSATAGYGPLHGAAPGPTFRRR